MTPLGLIRLCGSIKKQPGKPKKYGAQYVDITINGKPARAMVDTSAKSNIMTKTTTIRLGLSYSPSDAQLKTVNAPLTPVCRVAHGVIITLGEWQGKTNFTVTPLDLFDIILGQEFFQECHTVIEPYLQQLLVMEQEGSCMVPLVKVPKTEEQVRLTTMQLVRGPKKKESAFIDTIASLKEDNGAKRSLPPCMKKVLEENNVVMPKKPPRRVPHKKEANHKTELKEIKKQLKGLYEGHDRVNGLLVAHTRDSDAYDATRSSHQYVGESVTRPATS